MEAFVRRVKDLLPADVYLLDMHPYEGHDPNVHVAIIAEVDDDTLNVAQPQIARAVEETNLEIGFDPVLV